jgi:hypothetical protein
LNTISDPAQHRLRAVFCKPDALVGDLAVISGDLAAALLLALAVACEPSSSVTVPSPYARAAQRAAHQIRERARGESTFRGRPRRPVQCVRRLADLADSIDSLPDVRTVAALRLALAGMGFQLEVCRSHFCTAADVDGIYGLTTTTVAYATVRTQLCEYLVGREIEVWWLRGDQAAAMLEWWKTYVRHLLLPRPQGTYLLRNLVHVCEIPDQAYLSERLL